MSFRSAIVAAVCAVAALAQDAGVDHFEKKIRPILAANCYACHSSALAVPQGGLLLDSARGIRKGGNSGPVIQAGDPDRSLLVIALRHTSKTLKMPPAKPLPPEIVADFESWIRSGAPLPAGETNATKSGARLWSLKKPVMPLLPDVRDAGSVRNQIDRFVLNRLEAKGLSLSPQADRRTLIRRATYDLTGLPPTPVEIDQFLADKSADAYERLIDRLLASPRYGERWARHWLDVARYADSVNDSVNAGQRYAWSYTYRDWVIAALNDDLPYDRFVLYQLAADRVPEAGARHLAALGFLSLGREFPNSYPETVDDRIDAVTRGFLGLTVSCARCHDHKYDPIPTRDYYSLYSVLTNIRQPSKLPLVGKAEPLSPKQTMYQQRLDAIEKVDRDYRARRNAEMVAFFKTQIAEYLMAAKDAAGMSNPEIEELIRERQLNQHILSRWREFLNESKASGEPVFRLWHAASAIPAQEFASKWPGISAGARIEIDVKSIGSLRDLAVAYAALLARHDRPEPFAEAEAERLRAVMRGPSSPADVPVEEFQSIYTEGDSNNMRSIRVRYNNMLSQAAYDGAAARAMAVEDVPKPAPVPVFLRGNPNNPGAMTRPRFLTCLGGSDEQPFRTGSGRLELARAIIDPANPLTARVMVNRVWMHHFGAGLVRTPSDFGLRGEAPTHPELLDYLAVKFVESGWSLKKMHRLIMTSATYRQSSADRETGRAVDPENQLLWRMNRRRLEIESLWDSMLAVSGQLQLASGGVPFALTAQPSVPRRSVYGFIERGRVPAVLNAFDFASPDQHAPMRYVTTVPQQALFFMNSPFIAEQAQHLATRPEVQKLADPEQKIRQLYRFVFGRQPEDWELSAGLKFLKTADSAQLPPSASPWQYGTGEFDAASGRLTSFELFPVFVSDRWQGGAALPAAHFGKAALRAGGGEPGEEPRQSVVRRWVSPITGKLNIEGTLRHGQPAVPYGDGVRGRIVSSRLGELASWSVNGSSAETKLNGIAVEKGDTIDFLVESRRDPENDAFNWAPVIKSGEQVWNSTIDFAGPQPKPLDAWARYAQVLMQTNEFAFVD